MDLTVAPMRLKWIKVVIRKKFFDSTTEKFKLPFLSLTGDPYYNSNSTVI